MTQTNKFKSLRPVLVKHDRGEDRIQAEGTVIKVDAGRVYLKGLIYDFSVSLKDFNNFNLYTKA